VLGLAYIAKSLLRTLKVGSPQASTSCDSGKARQSFRRLVSGLGGIGIKGVDKTLTGERTVEYVTLNCDTPEYS
jgi:hypothetical protein